jgi:hypothetical protein
LVAIDCENDQVGHFDLIEGADDNVSYRLMSGG